MTARISSSLAALTALAFAASAWGAAPQSVAEIATYAGADRQQMLEEGAKKEGSFLLYTTGTQMDPIHKGFGTKYPFIRVEVFRDDAPGVTRRAMEEFKANRHSVDVIDLSTGGLYPMKDAGLFQPYKSPQQATYRPDSIEKQGYWTRDYEGYIGLGYNTKQITAAEAPKTWDDLLDPKWKGKLGITNTSTTGNWLGVLLDERNEDFIKKLGAQQFKVFNISGRALANLVISGEVPLSPTIFASHVANSKTQNAPIEWRALGGAYANVNAVALAAKSPHPHAAMLYIDFVLSKDIQIEMQKMGYATARTDLENFEKPQKIYDLTERPNYNEEYEKWAALARRTFGNATEAPK
jgi:iron(III) transport system substrate-binding protein